MHRGEGLLPGAERFHWVLENRKYDSGSEGGEASALSSFFYDPLLLVNPFIAQIEYALKKNHFANQAVLQTSPAALVAAFQSVTGQARRGSIIAAESRYTLPSKQQPPGHRLRLVISQLMISAFATIE